MHHTIQHGRKLFFLSGVVFFLGIAASVGTPEAVSAASSAAKIHLLTLNGNTNAVLLESVDESGQKVFGMVDSGEDWDYPDGSDPRYPLRPGTTTNEGFDQEVETYLASVGVTSDNLEFYVATHPHSDHIGTADTIIRDYHPDRVYLMVYDDAYVSQNSRLWDNLYVYDQTVAAAQETEGVTLIQHLDPNAASVLDGYPDFALGSFQIQIVNYEEDYLTSPKYDANQFCLGVIASANGHRSFLSSDIDNTEQTGSTPGDLDRIVSQYGLYQVDMITANHHGYENAMDRDYLTAVSPKYIIQTGHFQLLTEASTTLLNSLGSKVFSTTAYTALTPAIVVDFSGGEVSSNVDATYAICQNSSGRLCAYYDGFPCHGFFTTDGKKYYADENGLLLTSTNWKDPATDIEYIFDENGVIISEKESLGWKMRDGK